MDSMGLEKPDNEDVMVASPTSESFEAPRKGLQEQFDKQRDQEPSSAADDAPATSTSVREPESAEGDEAKDSTSTAATRGGAAGKGGKGRGGGGGGGGGRVPSTTSAKGRGGSAAKGAARGGGKAGASTSARGGAKGGRGSTSAAGKGSGKGSKAAVAAAKSKEGQTEASGSGSLEGGNNSIGSGPSNTIFPLARVSRIVKVDKEIEMTSKDAIWTIAVATELFIKHLTDSAYAKARLDKKKTITFKELSAAVESQNEFFFLQDVIPQTIPFSKALEMRQVVEERNHMREAGLFDDEDEEVEDSAPLINQTIGNETEDVAAPATSANKEMAAKPIDEVDEQGDMAMEEKLGTSKAMPNGHSEAKVNGTTSTRDEEMMM